MKPWWMAAGAAAVLLLGGCDKAGGLIGKVLKRESAGAAGASAAPAAGDAVTDLAAGEVSGFTEQGGCVVVLDFHAGWCPPCRELGPILERVARDSGGKVRLGKVDVDKAREVAGRMGVRGIPDVRMFRDGRQVDRFVGMMDEKSVRERIGRHTAGIVAAPVSPAGSDLPPAKEAQVSPMSKDWLPPGMNRR